MRKFFWMLWLVSAWPAAAQPVDSAGIYDKLWVQTSADYRAHCLQTYGWATRTLRERAELNPLRDEQGRLLQRTTVRTAAGRIETVDQPLAVVMDLDDTVIDMSAYRVFLSRLGRGFEIETWNLFLTYLADHPEATRGVPGAVAFINEAERLGYSVFFVSNRTEPYRISTLHTLQTLGIEARGLEERLRLDPGSAEDGKLAREILAGQALAETSSLGQAMFSGQGRKERRRFELGLSYRPVLFVGDDLGDFISFVKDPQATPEQVVEARYQAVQRERERWGREYFFLPNPMYGGWSPGSTLPSQKAESLLHDDGFVEFYRKNSH